MIQFVAFEVYVLGSCSDYHRFKSPINCSSIESDSESLLNDLVSCRRQNMRIIGCEAWDCIFFFFLMM